METGIRTLTASDLSQNTTQKLDVFGALGMTADGRRYRYVGAPGAVGAGQVVIAPSLTSGHQNIAVAVAAKAGDTQVIVTLGAAAATQDQYEGGYLTVGTDGSGVPVTRKIRGNTVGLASGQITVLLDNKEPLLNPLTTSQVVSLAPSPYSAVSASATAGLPVGVSVANMPSGQSYGWLQTGGPCGVINDAAGALTALAKIKQSSTVAGAVVASSAATDITIGHMIQSAATGKSGLAQLTLQ